MRNAKLSEYQFLKVLRGFADDIEPRKLATDVRTSEKTIRTLYRALRRKLLEAAVVQQHHFGGAGHYLFRQGKVTGKTKRFLEGVSESDIFTDHIRRHAPRIHDPQERKMLRIEVAIRVFCHMAMKDGALTDYPSETRSAVAQIRDMRQWIADHIHMEGFVARYGHIIDRVNALTQSILRLVEQEELLALRTKSRMHHFPNNVLYDDLRRFLLKNPI
jgi:hypothetical protein